VQLYIVTFGTWCQKTAEAARLVSGTQVRVQT